MLEIKSLKHTFQNEKTLDYGDWSVNSMEGALILGDSGSGKTTLLHLIGGLLRSSFGTLSLEKEIYSNYSNKKLDSWRGNAVGIVFQNAHLVKSLNVKENLDLVFSLNGKKIDKAKRNQLISSLKLEEVKNNLPHQISQGQAQRVSIARALVNSPKLLLADEPTASLDDTNTEIVVKLLKEQAKENSAMLIISTHDSRVKTEFQNTLQL